MKTLMAASLAIALMATASAAYAQADDHRGQSGQHPPGGDHRPAVVAPPRNAPQGSRIDGNHTASRQEQGGQRQPSAPQHAAVAPQVRQPDQQRQGQQQRQGEQQHRVAIAPPQQQNRQAEHVQRDAARPPQPDNQAQHRRQTENDGRSIHPDTQRRQASVRPDVYRDRRDGPQDRDHRRRPEFDPRGSDIWTARQFRDGDYDRPRGYDERRWDHGQRLPPQYYGREYWIVNFLAFGLFVPPSHLIWVRVDDDALLIDEDTGEIVQVARNVFY